MQQIENLREIINDWNNEVERYRTLVQLRTANWQTMVNVMNRRFPGDGQQYRGNAGYDWITNRVDDLAEGMLDSKRDLRRACRQLFELRADLHQLIGVSKRS